MLGQFPAAHVVTARDHSRADALGDPGFDYEVADIGLDPQQITRANAAETHRITRMNPERIGMGDLVEPFRIGAARVYLDGHAESGDEDHLVLVQLLRMDVALDIAGDGMLRPAPIGKGGGIELEPAAGGGETAQDSAVDLDTDRAAAVRVRLWCRQRNDVRPSGPERAGVGTARGIDVHVIELVIGDHLLM